MPVAEQVSRLPRVAAILNAGKWGKLPFKCKGVRELAE